MPGIHYIYHAVGSVEIITEHDCYKDKEGKLMSVAIGKTSVDKLAEHMHNTIYIPSQDHKFPF